MPIIAIDGNFLRGSHLRRTCLDDDAKMWFALDGRVSIHDLAAVLEENGKPLRDVR